MVVVVPEADMEAVEEVVAPAVVAKGKRTKRQRLLSPVPITIVPPPHYTGDTASAAHSNHLPPFYAASSEESTTTEEENTAWCLVLLSQGHFENDNSRSRRRYDEAVTTSYGGGATKGTRTGTAACLYTCKTCNRSFSSFQALGGHRASHSKPKNEKKPAMFSDDEDFPSPSYLQLSSVSTSPYSATMKSPRMHECSYCGAEFTSGQALGGHMRKHRGAAPINRSFNIARDASANELEPENGLSLDLNLSVRPVDGRGKSPKEANQRFHLPLLLHP